MPKIPRTYTYPAPHLIPVDDENRNPAIMDYVTHFVSISKDGLRAQNAITIQAMRRLYHCICADPFDMEDTEHVTNTLTEWLSAESEVLDVTPQNAMLKPARIRELFLQAIDEDRMEDGQLRLPPRQAGLQDVAANRPQLSLGRMARTRFKGPASIQDQMLGGAIILWRSGVST
jgi:hypothetical protein